MGGFLAIFRLCWEAWCSQSAANTSSNRMFSKSFVFVILAFLDFFQGPSWLILDSAEPKMGAKIQEVFVRMPSVFSDNWLDKFWDNSWRPFWGQNLFKKGLKMGPILETTGAASQGPGVAKKKQNARVVEKGEAAGKKLSK